MTESDIVKLESVYPDPLPGWTFADGEMFTAPDWVIVALARHPWDSVTLRGIIDAERLRRNL